MDIDLLSKMVKEMILDQDRVVLPGLGSFVAEIVPSTFSDKGYTINPPYRRLFFRQKPDEGGDLVTLYAESNRIEPDVAEKILRDFLTELRAILYEKKTVVFPGLGRLRATKENNLFFIADEDLDIYPEGFGLEPISLKTHQETPEQVTAAVEGLKSLVVEMEPEPVVETQPEPEPEPEPEIEALPESEPEVEPMPTAEPFVEIVSEPKVEEQPAVESEPEVKSEPAVEPESKPESELPAEPDPVVKPEPVIEPTPAKSPWKSVMKIFIWLIVVAIILLAAFAILGHIHPELVDRFLYTPEELEILNL